MATISKIVKNIYGEDELIQLIVPDGWGGKGGAPSSITIFNMEETWSSQQGKNLEEWGGGECGKNIGTVESGEGSVNS